MKYALSIFALLATILVLGCVGTGQVANTTNTSTNTTSANIVKAGDTISVDYTGTLENGTVFDTSIGRQPLEFKAGAGQMIKGFDAAVIGMSLGEEKTITIQPQDAYGQYSQSNVISVPIANIPNNTKVGDTLYAGTQTVKVLEINSTSALIDANHPLAGKTLIFKIKIVKITPA